MVNDAFGSQQFAGFLKELRRLLELLEVALGCSSLLLGRLFRIFF
jgi:hypothetical protein